MQTWAIFLDSYRELNSKKLFWITLILSVVLVGIFACFGVNERGMSFLYWTLPIPIVNSTIFPPAVFYKMGFIQFGVQFWLAWGAAILALVSTAPLFPDFLAGGAIELVLSKPISRTRLFLTKYIVGLMFVGLQVSVFTAACFALIGIRGGVWEAKVFLSIPIVLCFFSYLWCVCALLGVLTRSTIASLLLTLLFWFFLFLVNLGDKFTLQFREQTAQTVVKEESRIERMERNTRKMLASQEPEGTAPREYTAEEVDAANVFLAKAKRDIVETRDINQNLVFWNDLLVKIKTALPKTDETTDVLKRVLITPEERRQYRVEMDTKVRQMEAEERAARIARDKEKGIVRPERKPDEERARPTELETGFAVDDALSSRSIWWVIGTSLGFEAVVLAFAAWRFSRRDF